MPVCRHHFLKISNNYCMSLWTYSTSVRNTGRPGRQWRLRKKNWRLEFGHLVAKIADDQARRGERPHPSAKRAATGTVRIHGRGRGRIVIERGCGCCAKIALKNGCCTSAGAAALGGRLRSRVAHDQQAAADTKACHSIFRSCRSVFGS